MRSDYPSTQDTFIEKNGSQVTVINFESKEHCNIKTQKFIFGQCFLVGGIGNFTNVPPNAFHHLLI